MSANVVNNSAYLRTSREFPEDVKQLTVQLNKMYLDVANVVNTKEVGLYPTSSPAITAQEWFLQGNQRQQALRQVFTFTSTSAINHGIKNVAAGNFTKCYGSYTDGTKTFGLIFGNIGTAIAGQIVFDVTSTQIEFVAGAGAPTVKSGIVVVEWISLP